MEDLRGQIGSIRQTLRGHCLSETRAENEMGMARQPRAWGHQGKAKARRKARILSEMLLNAEKEEKSQAAPFF